MEISGADRYEKIGRALETARVMVVGDIMLDRFVTGSVDRISPESPVPVLAVRKESRMLGGAGNVLSNLAGLRAGAVILAVVGADAEGEAVRSLAQSMGADIDGLLTAPDRPTTVKTRFLAGHQQLLRCDFERAGPLEAALESRLLALAAEKIDTVGALVLSDYGKGVLSETVLRGLIAQAGRAGVPVVVDPKGRDYARYAGAAVVTPNRKELAEAAGGAKVEDDESVVAAAQAVLAHAAIGAVMATRSQDGLSLIRRDADKNGFARPVHLRAQAREVFDVSGAGDTVVAVVGATLAAGGDLADAAVLANLAGGIVVGKVGTAPIRAAELAAALEGESGSLPASADRSAAEKARLAHIAERDEAAEQIRRWQARGLKVGFTNGCFDILHPGHVGLFIEARTRCDRLVVGLNADPSVRRLKGPQRPVNAQSDRARVIGALGAVDMVVFFGEDPGENDTPLALLHALRPDILFKGGDYTMETIVGADFIRACGGEVVILPFAQGHSTTGIVRKIKEAGSGA